MAIQRLALSTRGKKVLGEELKKYSKLQPNPDQPDQKEDSSPNVSSQPSMEEFIMYLGNEVKI